MQKSEAMATFNLECSRAVQEFQDKRRELKESLKSENEDKRRQIEVDRHLLDINMDMTDAKPKVTRKLRRRGNANAGLSGADFNVDSSSSCLDATGSSVNSFLFVLVLNLYFNLPEGINFYRPVLNGLSVILCENKKYV